LIGKQLLRAKRANFPHSVNMKHQYPEPEVPQVYPIGAGSLNTARDIHFNPQLGLEVS
jgi:hypothetical protein